MREWAAAIAVGSTEFVEKVKADLGIGLPFGVGPTQPTITGTWLNGGGLDERYVRTTGGASSALLTDALGSLLHMVNAAGATTATYTYEPYGAVTHSGTDNTGFQYTGREVDVGGLMYYRARYYNPRTARFISEDPIGLAGGVNLYGYVRANPIQLRDPDGQQATDPFAGAPSEIESHDPSAPQRYDYRKSPREVWDSVKKDCELRCLWKSAAPTDTANAVEYGAGIAAAGAERASRAIHATAASAEVAAGVQDLAHLFKGVAKVAGVYGKASAVLSFGDCMWKCKMCSPQR